MRLIVLVIAAAFACASAPVAANSRWGKVRDRFTEKVEKLRQEPLVRKLRADAAKLRADLDAAREARRAAVRDVARLAADVDRLNRQLAEKAAALLERAVCHRDGPPAVAIPPCEGGTLVCVIKRKG